MNHVLGNIYVESGYIALDDKDGDITDNVIVESLNVNETGVQMIRYTVSDTEGNSAEEARTITIYNEAESFEGNWAAEYVYPYPSIDKQQYIELIITSTSENMSIVFSDFAGNTDAQAIGTVVMSGVISAPCVVFENQTINGKSFSANNASFTEDFTVLTVEYVLGTDKGVLVLKKQ